MSATTKQLTRDECAEYAHSHHATAENLLGQAAEATDPQEAIALATRATAHATLSISLQGGFVNYDALIGEVVS